MDRIEAQEVLGLTGEVDATSLRAAHRRRIRISHPDAGGSVDAAARLNEALAVLSSPVACPAPVASRAGAPVVTPADDVDQWFHVSVDPDELLLRLADAGHSIGEVVFVEPHAGLLEIVLGDALGVGQLAVTVGDPDNRGTPVSFTLEALGVAPAPPINDVVAKLMAELDRG